MIVMKKRSILLSLLLVATMSSCDFIGTWYFYIENGLQSDTVTIKQTNLSWISPDGFRDSVFVLLPKERKLVSSTTSGPTGRGPLYDILADLYDGLGICVLGQFDVFINSKKLEKNLCERKYWKYTTGNLQGTYLLVIDERIIDEDN